MALLKQNGLQPQGFAGAVDPAVLAASDGLAAKRDRFMDPVKRKKAKADKTRTKSTFDLSPDLQARVKEIADALGVPPSHVAEHLMNCGLEAVASGTLNLRAQRIPSVRNLRYEFFLRPIFEGNQTK